MEDTRKRELMSSASSAAAKEAVEQAPNFASAVSALKSSLLLEMGETDLAHAWVDHIEALETTMKRFVEQESGIKKDKAVLDILRVVDTATDIYLESHPTAAADDAQPYAPLPYNPSEILHTGSHEMAAELLLGHAYLSATAVNSPAKARTVPNAIRSPSRRTSSQASSQSPTSCSPPVGFAFNPNIPAIIQLGTSQDMSPLRIKPDHVERVVERHHERSERHRSPKNDLLSNVLSSSPHSPHSLHSHYSSSSPHFSSASPLSPHYSPHSSSPHDRPRGLVASHSVTEFEKVVVVEHRDLSRPSTPRSPASPSALSTSLSPRYDQYNRSPLAAHHHMVADLAVGDIVVEESGEPVTYYVRQPFANWGNTVHNEPSITFTPRTVRGVQNIVKFAARHNKRVRASGYRHTWANMYSQDGAILISMLPLGEAEDVNHVSPIVRRLMHEEGALDGIKLLSTHYPEDTAIPAYKGATAGRSAGANANAGVSAATAGASSSAGTSSSASTSNSHASKPPCQPQRPYAYVKIGAATTNDQFRAWCLDNGPNGGKWQWTIPLNVIMVEITFGGSNAPICHGSGLRNKTLSDLVVEIEWVNVSGQVQRLSALDNPEDARLMRAASGAFGLLGIVTSLTLRLDEMTYAAMRPTKTPVMLSVPPPIGWKVPYEIAQKNYAPSQLEAARKAFEHSCEHDYYTEWFWFALQDQTWTNCWNNDGKKEHAKPISQSRVAIQNVQSIMGRLCNAVVGRLSGSMQTKLISDMTMAVLPDLTNEEPDTVPLIEGLHFRRGIQNLRVVDMELQIPIPGRADDPSKPDWNTVQKAWWSVINLVYEYKRLDKYPLRLALEMRIMGGSDVIMSPQFGNDPSQGGHGTCSIEILTTPETDKQLWREFMQQVCDLWCHLEVPGRPGEYLNVRTHWAKQWQELKFRGVDAIRYIKDVQYKGAIKEFRDCLAEIAERERYLLEDMCNRFSNPLFDTIFFDSAYV